VKPATATPTTAYLTPLLPTGLPIAPGTPADAGLALALTVAAFARRRRVLAAQAA
jgi:hypothetical protein